MNFSKKMLFLKKILQKSIFKKITKFLHLSIFSVYIRSKKIPAKFEDDRIKTQGGHELFPPNDKSGPLCSGGTGLKILETHVISYRAS